MHVPILVLPHAADLPLPSYQTRGSSGMDLLAAVSHPQIVEPGQISLIPTGLKVALPIGFEFQVRPRSGLALKHGITLLNTPGTIDADYRGEIQVILANLGKEPLLITRGMRIAQMVLCRVESVEWQAVEELDETSRGDGGFGHTGR